VGVVDAAGRQARYHAEYILRGLGELGYPTVDAITPSVKAQPDTRRRRRVYEPMRRSSWSRAGLPEPRMT
jgi:hypothetical protein